jgi:putative DNA primase/helicase
MLTQPEKLCNIPVDFSEIQRRARAKIEEEQAAFAQPFTDTELLKTVMGGELGDARLFSLLNSEKLSYDHAAGQWYEFSGHFWKEDEVDGTLARIDEVMDLYAGLARKVYSQVVAATKGGNKEGAQELGEIEKAIRKKIALLQRRRHRENVLVLAAAGPASLGITGREWDSNPYLLPFQNGVLDLRTHTFRPGRPDDHVKTICPIEWRGFDAPAPRWEKFLFEILNGDVDVIAYLKRLFGYGIAGLTVEHFLPIFWGPGGRNGKGSLLEILGHVLGPLAGPVPGELMLEQKNPRSSAAPSPDLMALRGKRLTWASETDEGRALSSGRIKWLCGGDTITARPPFGKRQVNFPPTHTLMLLTNFRPRVNPGDDALWDRLHLIEFKISFVDDPVGPNQLPRDKDLATKLKKEAPGIMAWLVSGFAEWQAKGLKPPPQVINATRAYRRGEDLIQQFFDECCTVSKDVFCRSGEIFEAYQRWCEERGVKSRRKKFYEKLTSDFNSNKSESGKIYKGIGLTVLTQ